MTLVVPTLAAALAAPPSGGPFRNFARLDREQEWTAMQHFGANATMDAAGIISGSVSHDRLPALRIERTRDCFADTKNTPTPRTGGRYYEIDEDTDVLLFANDNAACDAEIWLPNASNLTGRALKVVSYIPEGFTSAGRIDVLPRPGERLLDRVNGDVALPYVGGRTFVSDGSGWFVVDGE